MSRSRGCSTAFALLVIVLAAGAAGWWFRGDLAGLLGRERPAVVVSPEAATLAQQKLDGLRAGGEPVRISSIEASSLLRYGGPAWVSDRVHDPLVEFAGDTVRVSGAIATSDLPSQPDLDKVKGLLPDTSKIVVTGKIQTLPSGRTALEIGGVTFAGIPIPERYYPQVLERFGRQDEPGLSPTALAVPLPPGVKSAHIEGGSLVLTP
jgi:hypothetical protein